MTVYSQYTFNLLEQWLSHKMAYENIPSLAIGVTTGSEVIYTKALGHSLIASQTNATDQTLYRIMSLTKPFTALAIMLLNEQRLLSLDTPIVSILPWFNPQSANKKITIRHLLSHASGLPREFPSPYWSTYLFPKQQDIQNKIHEVKIVSEPGTQVKYSNLGYFILGQIIEAVSGQTYHEFVAENILKPLGLTNTFTKTPSVNLKSLATGYTRRDVQGNRRISPHLDSDELPAAFNMTSSVVDIAKFLQFHLKAYSDKSSVLSKENIIKMHSPEKHETLRKQGAGLGFTIFDIDGLTLVTHSGISNGYFSGISFCPQMDIGIVVLSNCAYAPYGLISHNLFSWLLENKDLPKPSPYKNSEIYSGRYTNSFTDVIVLDNHGELCLFELNEVFDPTETKTVLKSNGQHSFTWLQPQDNSGKHLENIVFNVENGKATHWTDPAGCVYQRVEEWP